MVTTGARLLLIFLCGLVPARGDEAVTLAVPLSLQPYFIPVLDEGLEYEAIVAAFAARGRTIQPFYISQRKNARVLDRHPTVDCAVLQSAADAATWFAADEVFSFHDFAATLTVNRLQIRDVDDLRGKKIIGYVGSLNQLGSEFRDAVQDHGRYTEVSNHRAQVQLLLANRAQVIIADRLLVEWYLDYLAKENGLAAAEVEFHDLFSPIRLKLACRRQDLIDDFTAGLEVIRRNGQLDAIRERYLTQSPDTARN